MNRFFRPCLFFLSFLPLWISIGFLDSLSIWEGGETIWTEQISLVLLGLGILISLIIVLRQIKRCKNRSATEYTLRQASPQRAVTSEYLLSYILPLFTFDFTRWTQVILFLIFFATLAFLCLRHNNIYANIFLEIQGFTCYECSLENADGSNSTVVISKENLAATMNYPVPLVTLGDGYKLHIR